MLELIRKNWSVILERVKEERELTDVSFNTWLLPLQLISFENDVLTILFSGDQTSLSFIIKRYEFFLTYMIEEVTGIKCKINFVTSLENKSSREKAHASSYFTGNLNSRYTFDTFVVGNNNKMAHAASLAVAESPAEIYNPLFIYGGAGLGKTHLMQSIAHFILKQDPSARVLYVTCEKFTIELIDAIRNKTTTEFKEKYRNIDVLLIDDIQFIINKDSTQEEVFHTFNALYESKKQIIISSDRPPKELKPLEERLRSRFEWGLTVDIGLPDYETRMAILRRKEEIDGYNIDNEVIKYIATNIKSNIRELEGALTKIVAMSRVTNRTLNLEMAEEALRDSISTNHTREITPPYILNVVADHFNIKPADILSEKRDKNTVIPRQITMYLCKEMASVSLQLIGQFLGNRDHSTVIYGCRKISEQLEKDESLRNTVDILIKKINPVG